MRKDVRLILEDEEYERQGYGDPRQTQFNGKWCAMCKAFSLLGWKMTGLPIDFQIQQRTDANTRWPGKEHQRHALGMVPLRVKVKQ